MTATHTHTLPRRSKFNSRMDRPPGSLNGGTLPPADLDAIDAQPVKPSNVTVWDWRRLGKVTPAKDQGDVSRGRLRDRRHGAGHAQGAEHANALSTPSAAAWHPPRGATYAPPTAVPPPTALTPAPPSALAAGHLLGWQPSSPRC